MNIPKNALTVEELVKSKSQSKVWLCPDIASHSAFHLHPLLQGIDCNKTTIPEELKSMKVIKYFIEDHALCVIWHNDDTLKEPESQE